MRNEVRLVFAICAVACLAGCQNDAPQADQADYNGVPMQDNGAGGSAAGPGTAKPTREQLRKRAKTDPEGADAAAIDNMSREEMVATAINTAGYLCARVTDLYPRGNDIVAHCVEYRSGSGKAQYLIRTDSMTVEKLD